jgi:hypothetical protein
MSDLSGAEKRKLEIFLGMGSGYVLNFSNRTFSEFVFDSTGRDPYDAKYDQGSSKANRLRGFWSAESNHVVAKLIGDLADYACEYDSTPETRASADAVRKIAARLLQGAAVPEIDAITALGAEKDFEAVAKDVREAIERHRPEAGLDRLHTFVVKYVRLLCEERALTVDRDKPLHSIFGEYVKHLRASGHIRSDMAERILRSTISVFEAFNHVRNNQTLAHDNDLLDYDEALLIFNNVANVVRYLRAVEVRLRVPKPRELQPDPNDDIPF